MTMHHSTHSPLRSLLGPSDANVPGRSDDTPRPANAGDSSQLFRRLLAAAVQSQIEPGRDANARHRGEVGSLGAHLGAPGQKIGAKLRDGGSGDDPNVDPNGDDLSNMFMTLLLQQIKNQDPLDPMKPEQFVTQLTQMQQVQAMSQMSTLMQANSAMLESMLVVSLGSSVGSTVMAKTGAIDVTDTSKTIHGEFNQPDASSDSAVVLTGDDGTQYSVDLGAQKSGDVSFDIDPAKLGLPPGHYKIAVDAKSSDGSSPQSDIQVQVAGTLKSVRVDGSGNVLLDVAGIGEVKTQDITRFMGDDPFDVQTLQTNDRTVAGAGQGRLMS